MRSRMPSLRSLKRSGSPAPPPRSTRRRSITIRFVGLGNGTCSSLLLWQAGRSRRFLGTGRQSRRSVFRHCGRRLSPRRASRSARSSRRCCRAESAGQAARAAANARPARRFTWPPPTCCCWKRTRTATIKLGVQATADAAKQGAPTERVALFVRDAQGRIDGHQPVSRFGERSGKWPHGRPA